MLLIKILAILGFCRREQGIAVHTQNEARSTEKIAKSSSLCLLKGVLFQGVKSIGKKIGKFSAHI